MNPSSTFPTGIYSPPFGALRRAKPKPAKGNSHTRPYRSQSTNESRLYRQILDWRRTDARPASKKSQTTNTNPNDLIRQMRSLNIKPSESARDLRHQEKEKTAKKRTRFVITDLSSNNLARHDEKFFRPLTGREKQRRISVWVQNVERQRAAAPAPSFVPTCHSPSAASATGQLSASLVSQQGSSAPPAARHRQGAHQQQQRTAAPAPRRHQHGPSPHKRPHL